MADELTGVGVLQNEIEKARGKLKGYNENIKKLTGRDPSGPGIRRILSRDGSGQAGDGDNFGSSMAARLGRGRGRLFGVARRSIMEDNGPPMKRRVVGGAFSRLGPAPAQRREREDSPYKEEPLNKLSVQSSVVSTSRDAKNRKEICEEQTKDKEGMNRNRRMFGLLLGTLSKFKTDSRQLQSKEEQRKKIDQKLEENQAREKRKFQQETKLLVEEMHLEQSKISRLEQKMDMVQEHAEREEEMKKLKNFITTKAMPRIFWRPRQMTAATENQLRESKKVVDNMLQEGQDRLENEIKDIMDRETKREERIKMRLREDGLMDEDGRQTEEGAGGESENRVTDNIPSLQEKPEDDESEEDEDHVTVKKSKRRVVIETQEGNEEDDANRDIEDLDIEEDQVSRLVQSESYRDTTLEDDDSKEKPDKEEDKSSLSSSSPSSSGSEDEEDKSKEKKIKKKKKDVKSNGKAGKDKEETRSDHIKESSKTDDIESKGKERKRKESEEDGVRRRRTSGGKDEEKRKHEKDDKKKKKHKSEEKDKRRKKRDSSSTSREREVKRKVSKEESADKERSKHRRGGDEDRKKSRKDERDRESTRRDSRERERSKRDGRDERRKESRSHHTKDKSRGDKEEVVIKEEIEEVSERTKKTEDPELVKSSAMNLMGEDNDVEMESD